MASLEQKCSFIKYTLAEGSQSNLLDGLLMLPVTDTFLLYLLHCDTSCCSSIFAFSEEPSNRENYLFPDFRMRDLGNEKVVRTPEMKNQKLPSMPTDIHIIVIFVNRKILTNNLPSGKENNKMHLTEVYCVNEKIRALDRIFR